MRQRPTGGMVFLYRRRWPGILAGICGLAALIIGWSQVGFLIGLLAACIVGGLVYKLGHAQ